MGQTNSEKIKELKKQLEKYNVKGQKVSKVEKEKKEIAELKKQIRSKKYAGLKRTGKNLKVIGKNVGVVGKAVGKGFGKFIGEDPKQSGKKVQSVEDIMKNLPQ